MAGRAADFSPGRLAELKPEKATAFLYTVAMAFCAANDATRDRDKQTPGTYFAYLTAHLFAATLGVNPKTSIEVLHSDSDRAELPTDYIFDLGPGRRKIHLPVKTSTRERAIQVWAHQRVLDGVFGHGAMAGVLVALAETKLDRASLEVIEICVPEQWKLYQRYLGPMDRIYYLDPPAAYVALAPHVQVKMLGEFFREVEHFTRTA